ncbi:MAG: L-threonylcarbamoyladenylate synthase [Patescibacteria group bacterium]
MLRFKKIKMLVKIKSVVEILKNNGVGVIPTDTIYGLVGSALSRKTVTRIYELRERNPGKPMIILVASIEDIRQFGIRVNRRVSKILDELWPGKVSVILPRKSKKFSYLHRNKNSLAFRLPQKRNLIEILEKTGPLVAPSANLEGKSPAKTITEAKKYFGDRADFYLNGGKLISAPSTLVKIKNGEISVKRLGGRKNF